MSKSILFWPDIYLEQGHWLPTIVWANGLKAHGHAVSYMGIRDCASVVQPYGYATDPGPGDQGKFTVVFEDLYPLGYTRSNQSAFGLRWKPDHLFAIASGALDALFTGPTKPDLLVSGYFTALESLMLHYKYGVRLVLSTTYLRHPQEGPAIRALQNLLGLPRAVSRKLMESVMGSRWNPAFEIEDFVKPLETVDELLPCPVDFDFPTYKHAATVHHVEPCITPDAPSGDENAFWYRIPPEVKLIYATAGSQVQDYELKAEHLFSLLIDMMNSPQMENYHLILGVGPKLAQKKDWGASLRYTVASWVPQRSILRNDRTKAAVVHGGLATLKECVYFNRPLVVVPLGKDQMDNSLRARKTAIASLANADTIGSQSLLSLLTKTMSDPWMSARRGKMSEVFHREEDLKPGLALLLSKLAD